MRWIEAKSLLVSTTSVRNGSLSGQRRTLVNKSPSFHDVCSYFLDVPVWEILFVYRNCLIKSESSSLPWVVYCIETNIRIDWLTHKVEWGRSSGNQNHHVTLCLIKQESRPVCWRSAEAAFILLASIYGTIYSIINCKCK